MITSSFTYKRAGSVEEALQLKAENEDSKFLAGGHSLVPTMKLRLNNPEVIIDITKIEALKSISDKGDHIEIGSLATHADILNSELVQDTLPVMSEGAGLIGDVQVRNRGTIGGSIAHADPAADWPSILLTVDATIVVQGAGGTREIAAQDFFLGVFMTALEEDEIVTTIKVPKPQAGTKSTYLKYMQPASRFAIVGCAVSVTITNGSCTKARVSIGGAAPNSFRDSGVEAALEGQAFNADTIAAAAAKAGDGVKMASSHFASDTYRQHLVKVYVKRALEELL